MREAVCDKRQRKNKMSNNKQYKKSRVLNGVLGGLLALVVAGGVAFVGVLSNGFKNWDNIKPPAQEEPNSPEDNTTKGEASIENGESAGIRLMAMKIPVADYKTYGVSVQAETAYTVTATVYPEDAANKKIDWSVAFANASSTWASGKKVTDYVTVTPSSDGALTAVIQNVAAFGEQIVVKTVSRDNAEAYATLNVEYLQRTTGYTLTLDDKTYSTTGTKTNSVTPDFSIGEGCKVNIVANKSTVYTRANTDKAEYITVKPTEAFKSALAKAGSDFAAREYGLTLSGLSYGWFDSTFVQGLTNAQKNKLISAIKGFSGNAYEIAIYTANGGTQLATFGITLDSSVIVGQKGVESITTDKTELVF